MEIRFGFWVEPAGSPCVSFSTRRCCLELCLLQVFGDQLAHVNFHTCNQPDAIWLKWVASASIHITSRR